MPGRPYFHGDEELLIAHDDILIAHTPARRNQHGVPVPGFMKVLTRDKRYMLAYLHLAFDGTQRGHVCDERRINRHAADTLDELVALCRELYGHNSRYAINPTGGTMSTEFGLPADQRTIVTADGIEPIPGMGVCDFCTSTPVSFRYDCGLILMEAGGVTHATNDPWAACEHCHALIEADDHAGLAERALGGFIVQEGEQPAGVLSELREMFTDVQAAFFAGRTGDAQPV